jgi:Asp-tRNA(Asn)/Glu-tRNA(Gln) amidotransferase A subunit family amidase
VAAGFCPLALGTQTIGSIGRPASYCGVVGFKPSFGRLPTAGLIPLAPSLDHVGFFTSSVAGAELAASILCTPWRAVASTARPVLGIPEGPYLDRASAEGLAHFRGVCRRLAAAGFSLRPLAALGDFEEIEEAHFTIFDAEAARTHAAWYARYGRLYHAKTREILERGKEVEEWEVSKALEGREHVLGKLLDLMDRHGLDLWLSPSATGAAPRSLDFTGSPVMNLPWTYAGLPTVTVPSGRNGSGLPLGVQLTGRNGRDEEVLAFARQVEAALGEH